MDIQNNKKVHAQVSKTILEVLSQETLDTESIFTFSIYMHLAAFKGCFPDINGARQELNKLLDAKEDDKQVYQPDTDFVYANNQDILTEIFDDVYNNEAPDKAEWLIEWEKSCHDYYDISYSSIENWLAFSRLTNRHLEISEERFTITLFLIQRMLQAVL